jgi:hypothetical protein
LDKNLNEALTEGRPRYYILRASITLADGRKLYARDYGKRAFKIPVY